MVACGEAARVGGFTWRDDDWEVTRPRVTTAHQGRTNWLLLVFVVNRYGIILFVATESPLGAIVTRDVSPPSGGYAWGNMRVFVDAWGCNACVGCIVVCRCCSTSERFSLHSPRSDVRPTWGYDTRRLRHLGEVSPISFVIVFFSSIFLSLYIQDILYLC